MNSRHIDTLVIGSGIAGMFAALKASELGTVMLTSKSSLSESNTRYAQGGIAAALFDDDSVEAHVRDTLQAGAGLCDPSAVEILCAEGPARVQELIALGAAFDRKDNELARGLEAAHSAPRILHAGGDATGAEIQRALETAVRSTGINIQENWFLTDFLTDTSRVIGASFINTSGTSINVEATSVIVATGGAGQAFRYTTNPLVATGDGVAAAFRAGAVIADAEMYQFHPTLLHGPNAFLISEAVRGEGAILRNAAGERFMLDIHPDAELAPRDVVARSIAREMARQDGAPVLLDATHLGANFLAKRFPTINEHCHKAGFDWAITPIPITPAAHFWMGGIATDTWGRTSIKGLYAIGEAACTAVHGANRLASNSLLEGLVFAGRAMQGISSGDTDANNLNLDIIDVALDATPSEAQHQPTRVEIQQLTWDYLGLVRNEHGLRIASKQLGIWASDLPAPTTCDEWERKNLLTVAQLIAAGSFLRTKNIGAHFRNDGVTDTQPGKRFGIRQAA